MKVPSLPPLNRGQRVRLAIDQIELLEAEARVRYLELLDSSSPDGALGDEEGGE
jgi:hypothetical protein